MALKPNCRYTMYVELASPNCDDEAEVFLPELSEPVLVQSRTNHNMRVRMNCSMLSLIFLCSYVIIDAFDPKYNDFDAYGVKIAANDLVFVEANNKEQYFLVQFAPYKNSNVSFQCGISFVDPSHYVYSVGVGVSQPLTNEPYVYVAGEVVTSRGLSMDNEGRSGLFIGILINRDPKSVQSYLASGETFSCDHFQIEELLFIAPYEHQEYFVIAVEPLGRFAIGVAANYVFRYQAFPSGTMTNKSTSTLWTNGSIFYPCAADASESFTIVTGFMKSSLQSRTRVVPTVHLLWNDNLTVLSSWTYTPPENSWQSYLTYSTIDTWSKKFTMSVKINGDASRRVLVGMPFLNTVFLFQVNNNGTILSLASSMSYNKSVGFGKSVAWLSSSQAAILYSAYSLDYRIWRWSKIYVYTGLNGTSLPSSPTAMIPNTQQPLPSSIDGKLIRLISLSNNVVILDQAGGVLMIMSESAGSYASTDTTMSLVAATMPVVSHVMPCIGGTFKADAGIHPCSLCPFGSRNPGRVAAAACINCSSDAFCPLGAVYEIERASLSSLSQAYPYPRSPELTVYEDLLLNNMVTFGWTPHCLRVSPMFWTVILLAFVLAMLLAMASLNLCVKEPRRTEWRTKIKSVFLKTDLVVSTKLGTCALANGLLSLLLGCRRAKAKCGSVVSLRLLSF